MLAVGRYATHLERFYRHFPREQVRIYLYEDYRADPRGLLHDIFSFLGVRTDQPINLAARYNEPTLPRFRWLHGLRLRALAGIPLLSRLPGPLRRMARLLYHQPRPRVILDSDDRRIVVDYYREEIVRTAELIGRDLSAWLK